MDYQTWCEGIQLSINQLAAGKIYIKTARAWYNSALRISREEAQDRREAVQSTQESSLPQK